MNNFQKLFSFSLDLEVIQVETNFHSFVSSSSAILIKNVPGKMIFHGFTVVLEIENGQFPIGPSQILWPWGFAPLKIFTMGELSNHYIFYIYIYIYIL